MPTSEKIKKYLGLLQNLLPAGIAWTREKDSVLTALLEGLAVEPARVDDRALDLIDEADPRTTFELLTDWEQTCGLPDECTEAAETLQQRREAVVGKLTAIGGQTAEYFIEVAAQIGYLVTIDEFRPFRAGSSTAGDPLTNGDWQFTWRVNAPEVTTWPFKVGQSTVGEPLRKWGNEKLECAINRLRPAHTHVIYAYGGI